MMAGLFSYIFAKITRDDLLEKLPDDRMSDDELELLAPWNETVKAEIEHRANESNQSYVNCQGAPATEK